MWLQIPLSPRKDQEAGARVRLCSHRELPSGDVSLPSISEVSLGQATVKGELCSLPNTNSLSRQVKTEMTRDRPHSLANILQCVVTRNPTQQV